MAIKDFLGLTCIGTSVVQVYEPRFTDVLVGIINGVAVDVPDADLEAAASTAPVQHVCRAGSSEAVKLVFSAPTTPAHVFKTYI